MPWIARETLWSLEASRGYALRVAVVNYFSMARNVTKSNVRCDKPSCCNTVHIKSWVLLSIRTTHVLEVDLHFAPNYTPAKFHVCISNGCNAIMLTRFCWLSRTNVHTCQNTRNHLHGGPHCVWTDVFRTNVLLHARLLLLFNKLYACT